jgi:hypothetical protein
LISPGTRLFGLYSSISLLTLFTGYLVVMIKSYTTLPCTCGGVISEMTWPQHLLFNLGFIILGCVGIRLQTKMTNDTKNARL